MQKKRKKRAKKELFVAYYRVSTKKQSKDMLAQKTAVQKYLKNRWPPVKSFLERESGKEAHNRQELIKALEYCYENKATLIVAKLDRLSRDLEFIGWIQKTDIEFVCCDMPHATRETIGLMGVMARWERDQASRRTKEALAELKKKGVKLGYHRPEIRAGVDKYWSDHKKKKKALKKKQPKTSQKQQPIEKEINPTRAQQSDWRVVHLIKVLRSQGRTFREIAETLNQEGIPSRFDCQWHKTSVLRVADRNGLE